MASYRINVRRSALKDLRRIEARAVTRISSAIDRLGVNPRPRGSKRLAGRRDRLRVRVGDYRVLYAVDDDQRVVIVYNILHRREVYR